MYNGVKKRIINMMNKHGIQNHVIQWNKGNQHTDTNFVPPVSTSLGLHQVVLNIKLKYLNMSLFDKPVGEIYRKINFFSDN